MSLYAQALLDVLSATGWTVALSASSPRSTLGSFTLPIREFGTMLVKMARPSGEFQILKRVIKGIAVLMVNKHALRHQPVRSFPDQDVASYPYVRFCNFDPGSWVSTLVLSNALRSYWQFIVGRLSFPKLCRLSYCAAFGHARFNGGASA